MTQFRWGAATHVGQVRQVNQDNYLQVDGLFVVADGMGGHLGGEVASEVAIDTIRTQVDEPTTEALIDGVQLANEAIFRRADGDPELRGMGTTLCAVALVDDDGDQRLAVVNVGDSRTYRLGEDGLEQLTDDHSLVESLVREGRITREEAAVHPQRNIVTRALGVGDSVDVDSWLVDIVPGELFAICSDGLFNEISDDQIAATLRGHADPQDSADELVRLANASGGRDNVTVIVVEVVSGADDGHAAARRVAGVSATGTPEREEPPPAMFARVLDNSDDRSGAAGPETVVVPDARARGSKGRRRFPWRPLLFVGAVALVLVAAASAVGWYARANYFVDVADGDVAILQGRPGGVLWFDPTVEEATDVTVAVLTPVLMAEVENNPEFASIADARRYVDGLRNRVTEIDGTDDEPS